MKSKAIVSAHIYLDDKGQKDIEILSQVDNDEKGTGIFDDINHDLLVEIDIGDSEDYYFMAIVQSEFVKYENWEVTEYSVEHNITEIKSICDIR